MLARLLADENVPAPAVAALRQAGHDVAWLLEDAPGTPDSGVLARAQQEHRVLITFDKDFIADGGSRPGKGIIGVLCGTRLADPNRGASDRASGASLSADMK